MTAPPPIPGPNARRPLPRRSAALLVAAALAAAGGACEERRPGNDEDAFAAARERMVSEQIEARGVRDPRVLEALRRVPRHQYVSEEMRPFAYEDRPLPIDAGQTISQPYVVAVMTEAVAPAPDDVVLEIGTGSGYQAAVLAALVKRVYTIEIVPELALQARAKLAAQGVENVEVIAGDGWKGLPAHAPYDGIVVTAAPERVPEALLSQLAPGGRLVVPVGRDEQDLQVITRTAAGFETRTLFGVRFVPMVRGGEEAPSPAP